jgi:hypothetical protein
MLTQKVTLEGLQATQQALEQSTEVMEEKLSVGLVAQEELLVQAMGLLVEGPKQERQVMVIVAVAVVLPQLQVQGQLQVEDLAGVVAVMVLAEAVVTELLHRLLPMDWLEELINQQTAISLDSKAQVVVVVPTVTPT